MKFLEDLDLEEGKTLTMDCPVCKGVKKFTVTKKDDTILYNCFRNSCTVRGAKRVGRNVEDIKRKMNGHSVQKEIPTFQMPEYFSSDVRSEEDVVNFIMDWGLFDLKLFHDVKNDRVVFPIVRQGRVVDAIGKALDPKAQPKWYKYGKNASYYAFNKYEERPFTAVIVEDVLSAVTVANYFPITGFALLGTALTQEHILYLSDFDRVVVALDPDALRKTISHSKELSNCINEVRVLRLNDDLKYKNLEDFNKLKELINGNKRVE